MRFDELILDDGEGVQLHKHDLVVSSFRIIDLRSGAFVDLRDVTSVERVGGRLFPPTDAALVITDDCRLGIDAGMAGLADVWKARDCAGSARSPNRDYQAAFDAWDLGWTQSHVQAAAEVFLDPWLDSATGLIDMVRDDEGERAGRTAAEGLASIAARFENGELTRDECAAEADEWFDAWNEGS
jgi:hypothetical protein